MAPGRHLASAAMRTREPVLRPGRRRPAGLQLFASAQDEPRSRRPTDAVVAAGAALVVLMASILGQLTPALERSLSAAVDALPGFLEAVWRLAFWVPFG